VAPIIKDRTSVEEGERERGRGTEMKSRREREMKNEKK
jgi:hypothetical protein